MAYLSSILIFTPLIITSFVLLGCSGDGQLKTTRPPEALDTTLPTIGQMSINSGSATANSKTVQVSLQGSSNKSKITHFCLRLNSTIEPTINDSCWTAVDDPTVGLTPSTSLNLSNFPFSLGTAPGVYTVYAWLKNALGTTSELTSSNEGTALKDKDSIFYDVGTSPSITAFSVTNGTAGGNFGTTTFATGDTVNISWTIADTEGLSNTPVTLEYTTNNSTYTTIVSGATAGSTAGNPTSWTSSYNSFTAPTAGYFRLRMIVTDAIGNTFTTYSTSMNTSKWSLFAGTAAGTDGGLATASEISTVDLNGATQSLIQTSNGDIYIATSSNFRKISVATGLISNYMVYGTEQNIPGVIGVAPLPRFASLNSNTQASNMIKDKNDNIYIVGPTTVGGPANARIYKINTKTNEISIYAGGGTSNADDIPASSAIVMDYSKISINPNNNDIYFFATCDLNNRGTSGIIIRKVTQNEDGTAGSVTTIGGNCTRGVPTNGAIAVSSPLENTVYTTLLGLFYSPSTNAVYYSTLNTSGTFKIVNGKIYKISDTYITSFVYKASDGAIYGSTDIGPLVKIVPTGNQASDDVVTTYIANDATSTNPTCNLDGTLVTNACVRPSSLFLLANDSLGFADGPGRNQNFTVRIRMIDEQNKIRTLAGLMPTEGSGKDRLLARFSKIRRLVFKSTGALNQALFPGGLYVADGGANVIGHINLTTGIYTRIGGNMVSKGATVGSTFSANNSIGINYNRMSGGVIGFDSQGLITFYSSSLYILRVDSSGLIQAVLNGGTAYDTAADGTTATGLNTRAYGAWQGLIYDNNGNLYIGPQTAVASASYVPKFMRVDIANNKIYKVMGGTANATSNDDPTAGSALTKDFNCTYSGTGQGSCLMGEYDTTNDRLLFTEGNKIRFVTKPYNTTQSTLGTLLNAGRQVGAFSYVPGQNWVYYTSNNNLYCYDLSGANPAACNNTAITKPALFDNIGTETIARDASGNIYVVNTIGNYIYKYTP